MILNFSTIRYFITSGKTKPLKKTKNFRDIISWNGTVWDGKSCIWFLRSAEQTFILVFYGDESVDVKMKRDKLCSPSAHLQENPFTGLHSTNCSRGFVLIFNFYFLVLFEIKGWQSKLWMWFCFNELLCTQTMASEELKGLYLSSEKEKQPWPKLIIHAKATKQ